MRTIKFRAWDIKKKEMIYKSFPYHLKKIECECRDDISYINLNSCDCFIIMQFTGLKDKNGKEIYEGDILSKKGFLNSKPIEWLCNIAKFSLPEKCWEWEVIGNIHENPELLNK